MPLIRRRSPAARRREFRAQLKLRAVLEPRLARSLTKELQGRARKAARAFASGGKAAVAGALSGHQAVVTKALSKHAKQTFRVFGERVFDDLKSTGRALETKAEEDDAFQASIDRWLAGVVKPRAKGISQETQRGINEAIAIGTREGESTIDIARRIVDTRGGVHSAERAFTIAQTETHAASTAAQEEAVLALGIEETLVGEWISANDLRTRATHGGPEPSPFPKADGQTREIGKPFDVGGAKLLRPGDPEGPPQEVIACRCVIGYAPAE